MANPSWLHYDPETKEVTKREIEFVESVMIGADKVYWIEFQKIVPNTDKNTHKDASSVKATITTTPAA